MIFLIFPNDINQQFELQKCQVGVLLYFSHEILEIKMCSGALHMHSTPLID